MLKLAPAAAAALGLFASAIVAQQAPVNPDTSIRPDHKAYEDAIRNEDLGARAAALEKMIAAFPKSDRVEQARGAILDALLKGSRQDGKRIRKAAELVVRETPDAYTRNSVAGKLVEAGVLLEVAEAYARKALSSYKLGKYLSEQRLSAAKGKRQPPSEEVLAKRFHAQRAAPLATLGRVYVKQGKLAEAEKLLREAFEQGRSSAAATGLAELAEKRGDFETAFDYALKARLASRMTAGAVERLENLYRKGHNGSLAGLEEMLDAAYEKLYPNPKHAERYKAGPNRTNRVVLVEVFTGAGCPPCAGAELAFEAVLERYTREEVAVIMNHQHMPRPDPLANPATIARGAAVGLRGVPTYLIDGKQRMGGGDRDSAAELSQSLQPEIEKRLETPAEAGIALDAVRSGSTVTVQAVVDKMTPGEGALKLQVALVELGQRYSGENGIRFHPMVVRALAGPDGAGFTLDPGKPNRIEAKFDIDRIVALNKAHLDDYEVNNTRFGKIRFIEKKHEIDSSRLAVVAFVQDEKTSNILQSVSRQVR